ncbi:hypothetical protein FB382_004393 [Nocardioides ginsengisegetis]|uniref:HNH endonuclease n=1 Tax=Nocardioides ginsengisegetis TaxID=661491 RepID=A0A7W3J4A2_9ACTN|nr:hypothetical protein [Nocardioides ginsengisegetis]MBA8806042.1 hypothetical protein [Nocardioides ginsengisegetis]
MDGPIAHYVKATPPPCKIDGCDDVSDSRGWCRRHYLRWWRLGDPGPAELRRIGLIETCTADGCDKQHRTKGYCDTHYRRWKRGVPVESKTFKALPKPSDPNSYAAVHARLRATWGPASDYACSTCGEDARHWAYQHNDPHPLRAPNGMPYSTDIFGCYEAMCGPCHGKFDRDLDMREAIFN